MAPRKKNIRDELRAADESVLLAELTTAGSECKRKIAAELGRRGTRRAVEPLRLLLRSDDDDLRASAAEALGRIGDDSVGSELARLLSDERQPVFVRDTCAYSLARLAYAPALDILRTAAKDRHESIRRCALNAIAAIAGTGEKRPARSNLPRTGTHANRIASK
jgi:HEAT repeat protein